MLTAAEKDAARKATDFDLCRWGSKPSPPTRRVFDPRGWSRSCAASSSCVVRLGS